METDLSFKRDRLVETVRRTESCLVALSGGVDSAVAAKAAFLALGDRAVAVTGQSESLASGELDFAKEVAKSIGIRHLVVATREGQSPEYIRNAPDRCYHCKSELYTRMREIAKDLGMRTLVNGANADDLGDFRPGMQAAGEAQVVSPLAECDFHKSDVRELARYWDLPVWDKPAAPCLASRVAYGEEVTPARLRMVDAAEGWLKKLGMSEVRVRYHRGDLARIEVPLATVGRLLEEGTRQSLIEQLREIGFKYITLDLEGFRSGSLNQLVPLETITRARG